MNASKVPWWAWVIGIFLLLQIGSVAGISLLPVLIVGFVLWGMMRNQRRGTGPVGAPPRQDQLPGPPPGRPNQPSRSGEPGHLGPHGPGRQGWDPPSGEERAGWSAPADGTSGMPRIDVPRYPDRPAAGRGQRPGQRPGPGQGHGHGIPGSTPPPLPSPGGGVQQPGWSPAGSDPAVTLARMEVAQLARDLEAARTGGEPQRVDQVLSRLGSALDRLHGALSVSGQRGPDARAQRSRVEGVRGDVAKALREKAGSPQHATLVDRVRTGLRGMDQT